MFQFSTFCHIQLVQLLSRAFVAIHHHWKFHSVVISKTQIFCNEICLSFQLDYSDDDGNEDDNDVATLRCGHMMMWPSYDVVAAACVDPDCTDQSRAANCPDAQMPSRGLFLLQYIFWCRAAEPLFTASISPCQLCLDAEQRELFFSLKIFSYANYCPEPFYRTQVSLVRSMGRSLSK